MSPIRYQHVCAQYTRCSTLRLRDSGLEARCSCTAYPSGGANLNACTALSRHRHLQDVLRIARQWVLRGLRVNAIRQSAAKKAVPCKMQHRLPLCGGCVDDTETSSSHAQIYRVVSRRTAIELFSRQSRFWPKVFQVCHSIQDDSLTSRYCLSLLTNDYTT